MTTHSSSISRFFWLIVPLIFIVGQIGIEIFVPEDMKARIHSEWGPHETLQFFFVAAAFLVAAFTLPKIDWQTQKLLGLWLAIAAVCSFYVAGEEISWGQQIIHWDTPAYWSTMNDQNETNLHNTSSWLDQKPRLLLFIGIMVGGLVVPALRRWRPSLLPPKFAILYPADILVVTALGVTLPYLANEIREHLFHARLFKRVSELQELYMYYFILLYLVDLRRRAFAPRAS